MALTPHREDSDFFEQDRKDSTTESKCKSHEDFTWSIDRPERTSSCTEARNYSIPGPGRNRLKSFCSTIKRRFSISKEYRTQTDKINRNFSIGSSHYKSFSTTNEEPCQDFEWPDFEQLYDKIPTCLANGLPGFDDTSHDSDDGLETSFVKEKTFVIEETPEETLEEINRFEHCKRGKGFHRNAICQKLDKTLYNGQLDTFIQQLMVEKLIRTWT